MLTALQVDNGQSHHPQVAIVRDVAIILLAIQSMVIGVLMVVLLFQIRSLIRLIYLRLT